ncbi:MAG: hypothetical protein R2695_02290 [Acidimicrobiales bacterium]
MTPIKVKAGRDLTVQGQPGREFMIISEGEGDGPAQRSGHRPVRAR